jgi:hypothetical protein
MEEGRYHVARARTERPRNDEAWRLERIIAGDHALEAYLDRVRNSPKNASSLPEKTAAFTATAFREFLEY